MVNENYPVAGRDALLNLRIASHETGHAFAARILGNSVWSVTIIPGGGFEGRVVRSGPKTERVFNGDQTQEIIDVCEKLEAIQPEIGSVRQDDAEYIIIGQNAVIELVAGVVAERVLHPDLDDLGTLHDHREAYAFARACCVGGNSPAVTALIAYGEAEAEALIRKNLDVVLAIRVALIEAGELAGERVDEIISECVTARSAETERHRREDWKIRETNSTEFLKGIEHDAG